MEHNQKKLLIGVFMFGLVIIGTIIFYTAFTGKPTDETAPAVPVADSIETQQKSIVESQRPYQSTGAGQASGSSLKFEDRWVALITEFSTGDYVQQYIAGVRQEALALGLHLEIMDAKNNRKLMARMIDDATLRNADGIMISHGAPDSLVQSVRRSLRQGIPIVAVHCEIPIPEVTKLEQDETQIAELVLKKIIEDTGGKANLALIWVPGYEPMEKRMDVYTRVMADNPGLIEVKRFGAVTDDTALYAEITMQSVLQSHPAGTIDLVWATWDEFARGAARAIMRAGRKEIRLYGVDISEADLEMLQDPDNPWVATAAVDPRTVGQVQLRMLARALLGKDLPKRHSLQPVLITKSMLPKDVRVTMDNLYRYIPGWGEAGTFQLDRRDKSESLTPKLPLVGD